MNHRGGTKLLTSLNARHLREFVDEVWRCRPVKTFIHKKCTL